MKRLTLLICSCLFMLLVFMGACADEGATENNASDSANTANLYGGEFETELAWGEHLVITGGCGDCHTPKKMGPNGPESDMTLALSGHPSQMPAPPISQAEAAQKGLAVTQTLTAWVGPWGVSFTGNITSDSTGIGNWTLEQFTRVLREGKFKGLENGRPIMPPMPIEATMHYTDKEIKAIFQYLKSTKPIKNVVPAYQPPAA